MKSVSRSVVQGQPSPKPSRRWKTLCAGRGAPSARGRPRAPRRGAPESSRRGARAEAESTPAAVGSSVHAELVVHRRAARGYRRRGDARKVAERRGEALGVPLAALRAPRELSRAARARTPPSSRCRGTSSRCGCDWSARVPSSGRDEVVVRARLASRPGRSCGGGSPPPRSASSFVTRRPPSPAGRFLLDCSEKPPAAAERPDGPSARTSRRAPAPRPRRSARRCRSATFRAAPMSAAQPCTCTGMMAACAA